MRSGVLTGAIILGVALSVGGCAMQKEGSGVEASETRDLEPFSRLSLSGETDVVVTIGEPQSVFVRGDDNLLTDVKTEVDDDTLEISEPSNVDLDPKVGILLEITVPALQEVDVSGAGDVRVEGLSGDLFRAEVSGAGNVEASGDVDRVEAEVSGAGDIRFGALVAREATAEVSGAGDIQVHATESLAASVSGAGDITYTGDPPDLEREVSGAGEINPG
jgi:Putative auto-transporter adhesin, head GIN domain